ncbi:MAG: hypothetical protein A3B23_02910 [Candidatus Colwellbacteria bacterium RIFCSPLOWO2_01_FULL_48_10]|uniref:Ethylene receptor 1-like N-terminal domain-containing protein n=1 Tax=Candidatus Colwellbacteria bacterium RIFCSPLOWO2_01_FULL_48_10 TaxID=1797690 RepID=A0A1G1Z5W1_9BACT|nr:MAG: hypothetical protein A3B23_02910 [Candidatus Colwellbacteria bacterium RIFCSPLOWO2_01_FULL_48_10]
MLDLLRTVFTPGSFEPHSVHFVNHPGLMWIMVVTNAFIAICYLLLPAELFYIYFKRRDFAFSWVFIVIAFFGVWCSMTHIMNVATFWYPAYWLEGIISLTTGAVSLVSFVGYAIAVPLILKLVGPQQFQEANLKLSDEIENHRKIEVELVQKNLELEKSSKDYLKKSEDLANVNRMMIERELEIVAAKEESEVLRRKLDSKSQAL